MKSIFLLTALAVFPLSASASFDLYGVLESAVGNKFQPRVLNSADIPPLQPNDPEPLFSPEGDFNKDGVPDVAISGIFGLKQAGPLYFLLVATQKEDAPHFDKLFYKEYDRPVFIHRPGTTGEGDPGDQAFSISFCMNCPDGFDFYWDSSRKRFDQRPWAMKTKRTQKIVEVKPSEIPPDIVEKALKVVAALPDVQTYVKEVKKRGGTLGTRVEENPKKEKRPIYRVRVFEKKENREIIYSIFSVDVSTMKVVRRGRK